MYRNPTKKKKKIIKSNFNVYKSLALSLNNN